MHRIGQKTTLQERVTIGKLAAAGRTDMQIASRLDCSVWTVRKWRRIFAHRGRAGFTSQIGRPATGALSTIPRELQTTIRHLRETHPGWGPDTLLIALRADAFWEKQHLPSRSRVAAFLKQTGLTRRYQKHAELPQPAHQVPEVPHQEWQVDALGALRVDGIGTVSLINVIDVASRLTRRELSAREYDQACCRGLLCDQTRELF
jgi:transposase